MCDKSPPWVISNALPSSPLFHSPPHPVHSPSGGAHGALEQGERQRRPSQHRLLHDTPLRSASERVFDPTRGATGASETCNWGARDVETRASRRRPEQARRAAEARLARLGGLGGFGRWE